jgi:hypothetical protein
MVSMAKTLVSLFDNVVDVVIEGSLTKRRISRSVLAVTYLRFPYQKFFSS